jgi:hypothetical protein
MVGEVDIARGGGGCARGGERDEIGNVGDKVGVANGFSFGRGRSLAPSGACPFSVVLPLPLGAKNVSESRSKSNSDTSISLLMACVFALITPSPT